MTEYTLVTVPTVQAGWYAWREEHVTSHRTMRYRPSQQVVLTIRLEEKNAEWPELGVIHD